jgi:hypothetical protein
MVSRRKRSLILRGLKSERGHLARLSAKRKHFLTDPLSVPRTPAGKLPALQLEISWT